MGIDDQTEELSQDHLNGLLDQQQLSTKDICTAWTRLSAVKYNKSSSLNIFAAWMQVVDDCIGGKPLIGQHYKKVQRASVCADIRPLRKRIGI